MYDGKGARESGAAGRRRRLLVATANPHKVREYAQLLRDLPVELVGLEDVGLDGLPEETGVTFEENALLKARHCAATSGLLSLGDDSGLEVDALGGEPGVRSSRWAGPEATDAERNRLLLQRVRDVPEGRRGARFVCVVAVVDPDGAEATFRGELSGTLAREPRGHGGFGYDPIVYVPELERTVGELSAEEKHWISHRGQAAAAARGWLHSRL
jgi:XTP/dITP diphosphohydrolase